MIMNPLIRKKQQGYHEMAGVAQVVQWYFVEVTDFRETMMKYPQQQNKLIESAFQRNENSVDLTDVDGNVYIIDFRTMVEYLKGNPNDKVVVIRLDDRKAESVRPEENQTVETMEVRETSALLMEAEVRRMEGQMEVKMQTNLRAEIQRMENQFQAQLERMKSRMVTQVQAEIKVRVQEEIARMENQFQRVLSRMQHQLDTRVQGMVESRVQAEIARFEMHQKERMKGRCEVERTHTENTLQRELGRMKNEIESHLQLEVTQPLTQVLSQVNELQTHTGSGFTHMQEQFASEVIKLRREMGETQAQLISDCRQLKQQMVSDVTSLQSGQQDCEQSIKRTQNLLDMQDRMLTGLMADVGRQLRGELASLKDQIHTVSQQILDIQARLANQALAIPGIHPKGHQQQSQSQEDAGSRLFVANASDYASER